MFLTSLIVIAALFGAASGGLLVFLWAATAAPRLF